MPARLRWYPRDHSYCAHGRLLGSLQSERGLRISTTRILAEVTNRASRIEPRCMSEFVRPQEECGHAQNCLLRHHHHADIRRPRSSLGESEPESNGGYKWTLDDGSTLELNQSRIKLGWHDLVLSNWKLGREENWLKGKSCLLMGGTVGTPHDQACSGHPLLRPIGAHISRCHRNRQRAELEQPVCIPNLVVAVF